jgi:hypothetical protein
MADAMPIANDAAKIQQIVAQLKACDAASAGGAAGMLILGSALCLFMGVFVAGFVSYVAGGLGFYGWFGIYLLIFVPILIWQERRGSSDPLGEAAQSIDAPSSMGEARLNRSRMKIAAFASLLVWGPQAMISGYRGLRGVHSTMTSATFDRAALLTLDLSKAAGGIPIKRLIHPPENMRIFSAAVDLLDRHSWIGRSGDAASLWLSTTWRERLTPITGTVAMNRR